MSSFYGLGNETLKRAHMRMIEGSEFWKTRKNGNRVKCALFECPCGKRVGLIIYRGLEQNSCGCQRTRRGAANNKFKHGFYGHRLYIKWAHMKQRCLNPNSTGYERYGGKGIRVCQEWMEFEPFLKWALANGWKDGLTIERKNGRGNYEPGNCEFATRKKQARNRPGFVRLNEEKAKAIRLAVNSGESHKDIARRFGTSPDMVSKIKLGLNWL